MSNTGINIKNTDSGNVYKDVIQVWDTSLANATQTTTKTGFYAINGKDLANVFTLKSGIGSNHNYTPASACNLYDASNNDIGNLFAKYGSITLKTRTYIGSYSSYSYDSGQALTSMVNGYSLSNATHCSFLLVGGGGGGGAGGEGTEHYNGNGGGGGSSGQVYTYTNLSLGSGISNISDLEISIGSGGTGGTRNTSNYHLGGNNGKNGTSSSIKINGNTYTAKGGVGGIGGIAPDDTVYPNSINNDNFYSTVIPSYRNHGIGGILSDQNAFKSLTIDGITSEWNKNAFDGENASGVLTNFAQNSGEGNGGTGGPVSRQYINFELKLIFVMLGILGSNYRSNTYYSNQDILSSKGSGGGGGGGDKEYNGGDYGANGAEGYAFVNFYNYS